LVGIDCVGIGSDFDGGGGITGLQSANEFPQITMELIRKGYSDADIAKIWGGNLMRIMEAVTKNR
jgi:microsomal dipeptidase-like Zn-dependent dipeptidase